MTVHMMKAMLKAMILDTMAKEQPKLIQLQHINRETGAHDFVGQREVDLGTSLQDLLIWAEDLQGRHPLPERAGWGWIVVDERSELFWRQTGAARPIEDEGGNTVGMSL